MVPPFCDLKYGSVCSGIEAATVAWHPLGWEPAFFSEIEAFPRAVLQHHYPDVPLHGDFTTIEQGQYAAIDLLVGGTPCQDFSVAGLRAGLDGDRGNLSLEFLRLADRLRPRWMVWENVPGVFSANKGRAFGAIVGALAELGYGFAWRVLDAQFFGVPQRRRRVFIVGCLGNANAAAAVLFERASMSGHPAPSRKARQDIAGTLEAGFGSRGHDEQGTYIADLKQVTSKTNRSVPQPIAPTLHHSGGDFIAFSNTAGATNLSMDEYTAPPITLRHGDPGMIAYQCHGGTVGPMGTLRAGNGSMTGGVPFLAMSGVRRLTPRECERLQAFPDDYTLVPYRGKPASDGPRYRALGNSFNVNVVRWIGQRIAIVNQILATEIAA